MADQSAGLPLVVLIGPTASGKSSLAIRLAECLVARNRPAEIINGDSMVIYRGMDIGTAKPCAAELLRVRHHLVDIADIQETASVARFQLLARAKIAELRARGVLPILVGGSILYIRAIVDQFEFPGTDPEVRARWAGELARIGPEALHAELARRDPQAAGAIPPGNGRRIVRALEVLELTGSFRPRLPEPVYELADVHQFGLQLSRAELDARIADRVNQMWTAGFVAEVRQLAARGLRECPTASRGLGYQQVLAHLAGELTEEQARQATIDATRRFARKQFGWFRRDPRICWLDARAPDLIDQILAQLAADGCRGILGS